MRKSAKMKSFGRVVILSWILVILGLSGSISHASALSLDEILEGVEKRYSAQGFSAQFFQVSNLKAMQISETASGKLFVKKPGKNAVGVRSPGKADHHNRWKDTLDIQA